MRGVHGHALHDGVHIIVDGRLVKHCSYGYAELDQLLRETSTILRSGAVHHHLFLVLLALNLSSKHGDQLHQRSQAHHEHLRNFRQFRDVDFPGEETGHDELGGVLHLPLNADGGDSGSDDVLSFLAFEFGHLQFQEALTE